MKCEACGKEGTLDIRATLIRCSFCDGEWGRVNGFWVESKPPRCMECGGDGKTVEVEPKTCPSCAGTGREGGVKGGIEPSSPLPPGRCSPLPPVCMRNGCALYGVCIRRAVPWGRAHRRLQLRGRLHLRGARRRPCPQRSQMRCVRAEGRMPSKYCRKCTAKLKEETKPC